MQTNAWCYDQVLCVLCIAFRNNISPTSFYPTICRMIYAAYHYFNQKIWKFGLKVKWKSNCLENPFRNYRLLPEAVLFFHSEWNRFSYYLPFTFFSFLVSCQVEIMTGNQYVNGKYHLIQLDCWFGKNPYY